MNKKQIILILTMCLVLLGVMYNPTNLIAQTTNIIVDEYQKLTKIFSTNGSMRQTALNNIYERHNPQKIIAIKAPRPTKEINNPIIIPEGWHYIGLLSTYVDGNNDYIYYIIVEKNFAVQ